HATSAAQSASAAATRPHPVRIRRGYARDGECVPREAGPPDEQADPRQFVGGGRPVPLAGPLLRGRSRVSPIRRLPLLFVCSIALVLGSMAPAGAVQRIAPAKGCD